MKRFTILFLLLILIFAKANSQSLVTKNYKHAYQNILTLNFNRAYYFIEKEKVSNPDRAFTAYLENYIDFLKVFISEDESIFELTEYQKYITLAEISKLPVTSPYRDYLTANVNLHWAIARIKFGEYFSASIEINRAYRLIEKNTKAFPNFYPNKITHAILKIFVGLVPEKYDWVLSLISMQGSVQDGTEELYKVLEITETDSSYFYLRDECLFYLGTVELSINPNKSYSIKLLDKTLPLSDSSLLINYICIKILSKTGMDFQAGIQFRKLDNFTDFYPFYYIDYLHADFYLKNLETDSAKKYYSRFLKNFKGKNHVKDAWRKTAWAFLMEGKTSEYTQLMSAVGNSGSNDIGIDKDAQMEYEKDKIPNTSLIRARLLFDGFSYVLADSILNNLDDTQLDFDQLLEKNYRHARIKHESGDYEKAKKYYKKVVLSSDLTQQYFPANSSLKLGEIYEMQDSLSLSKLYYDKCSVMDFNQFENSIKSKAKEGLRRVERLENKK